MLISFFRFLAFVPAVVCLPLITPRQNDDNVSFKRLIVFGDSYSDDGHGAWLASNETWPADPAYYGHHFSNGPVWAQDMAANMSLELLDYAAGGATADNDFVQGYTGYNSTIPVPSTADQISTFLSNNTILPTDILALYIGTNDILFNTSITGEQLASILAGQVSTLISHGAQTILLATLPPLSYLPADLTFNVSTQAAITSFSTNLTVGLEEIATSYSGPVFNSTNTDTNINENANVTIAIADIGGLMTNIIAHPDLYGVNATYVNPPTACLNGAYPDEGERTLCDDAGTHLFFDTYHPTGRIHDFIAGVFMEALDQL